MKILNTKSLFLLTLLLKAYTAMGGLTAVPVSYQELSEQQRVETQTLLSKTLERLVRDSKLFSQSVDFVQMNSAYSQELKLWSSKDIELAKKILSFISKFDRSYKGSDSYFSNSYRISYQYFHEYLECLVAQFYFQKRAKVLPEEEGDARISSATVIDYLRSSFPDLDVEFESFNAHFSNVLNQIERSQLLRKSANFVSDKFVTDYKAVLKFDQLSEDVKNSFQSLLEDESFRNAGKFSDLPLPYRVKLAQRYGLDRYLDTGNNWDFPKHFDEDKNFALISREVQLNGRKPDKVSDEQLEEEKLKRNSVPALQTYAEKWQSEVKSVRVFHGGGFIYLSRFLLKKTQGGPLQAGQDPRYGIWVSPVKDEDSGRVWHYKEQSLRQFLDYPSTLSFSVSTQYLDSVRNKYEAGFCAANLDKMSDIVLTVDDLNYRIETNNIEEMILKLKALNLDQML